MAMLFPNVAVTRGIAVRVAVSFLAEQSDPSTNRWFWSYHVRIENGSQVAVQLLSRSWTIIDGRGTVHEVVGEGVVGEMPLIAPGASFDYVSGCPLDTANGAMSGTYRMVDEDGSAFDVDIPRFQLLGGLDEGNRTAISASELQSWVDEGMVEYLGETDDVRPFIANATALVLPSYREGLPRSLLEGAAMGRPLIATDVPGCRQVVEAGINGFLCAVRDARSLAEAMKKLADLPPEERSAMGAASRRMVQDGFSEQRVVRAYLEVLDGLRAR